MELEWVVVAGAVLGVVVFKAFHKMGCCGFGGMDLGGGTSEQFLDNWSALWLKQRLYGRDAPALKETLGQLKQTLL